MSAVVLVAESRYPNGHVVKPGCRASCCGSHALAPCSKSVTRCEYSRWTMATRSANKGLAFYYYCDEHWITEGPNGTSPRDRASRRPE